MTKKIFRGILFSSFITMLASMVFIIGVQYRIYDDSQRDSLESKARLISFAADDGEIERCADAKERVTLIESDGTVIYDNKSDAEKMENHAQREEVREAETIGSGYAVRQSETLGINTRYYALKLESGNILRVSDTSLSVTAVILELLPPICAVAVFAFVLALILASLITKKILKPINEINLDDPSGIKSYEELTPFVSRIQAQQKSINRQISELTRSRREFEIIAENMSEGLVLTDINGHIITHNSSMEKFFGVSGDLSGKNILNINRSETFRGVFESIKENRRSDSVMEVGGRFYEITVSPVSDESGNPRGSVILAVDITEKEKREKLRREFTANVSHELKTPLTSILGISDMLKNGMVASEDIKGFAEDINKETSRLISLVNDAKQGISISVTGTDAVINAGDSLIFEMIYNLCDNAVKYNRENGSVTVSTGVSDGKAFVSVKDTGIGIPAAEQERVFERFYRVDKGRSKQSGGTGLGLSIVKHIAVTFGGTIKISSEEGTGTEITVVFGEM